jgi:hypothetical protein
MAKLTAWLVTIIGLLMVLAILIPTTFAAAWYPWVLALLVLIIGIGKLLRNYKAKK